MKIGIPKEIKDHEYRVGATPAMVQMLVRAGHEVFVETLAGASIGYMDENYEACGAKIRDQKTIWEADLIIKVKEPQSSEFPLMHEGQVIFGYFHLAPDAEQTKNLIEKKVIAIAYETITDHHGGLPLLAPMSEIAGRVGLQAGATALYKANGGNGVLMGGAAGVLPAKVVVVGGGVSGLESAKMAMGLGADVTILDINLERLKKIDHLYSGRIKTLYSTTHVLQNEILAADLVVGAVLIPGKRTPHLISRDMVEEMKEGSVIVDIAIDQGGCSETSKPTTHSNPLYKEHGVVHYCVTNMPGAVARTSTQALTNATLHYAMKIAALGVDRALLEDEGLLAGLNIYCGYVTNRPVAEDLGYAYTQPKELLLRHGTINR